MNVPSHDALDSDVDIETKTRAVLSLLSDRGQRKPSTPRSAVDPATCPNCDAPCDLARTPYCCDECREMAAFVRQFRAAIENGTIGSEDRQAALGQKLWHLLGGGYPRRDALVSARVRAQVIQREGGRCQECGAKATTIDHSGSG